MLSGSGNRDLESLRFYGAPHAAFLFVHGDGEARLAADVGAYMQTLLLAMTAYGVDSCPLGLLSLRGKRAPVESTAALHR